MKQNWNKWMAAACMIAMGMLSQLMGQSSNFDYPPGLICERGPNLNPAFVTTPGTYPFIEVTGNVVFTNNLTGEIDLSASNPGTWTIKRVAPTDSTIRQVTITAKDLASVVYVPDTVCMNTSLFATPIVLGNSGGTFNGSPALVAIDTSSGTVDIQGSSPGTYTVTYITAGACPDTTTTPVTLLAPGGPFISYPQNTYCQKGAALPDSLYPGMQGQLSAVPSGLALNPLTGAIDLAQSQPGTYQITYYTPNFCTVSHTTTVQVMAQYSGNLFQYVPAEICQSDSIVLPIILGPTNISFTGQPAFPINASTGAFDPGLVAPGSYTIVATAQTLCQETSSQTITVSTSANVSLIQMGNTLIAPGPGTNHQWYLNSALIPGATDSSIVMSASGTYSVLYDRPGEPCGTMGEGTFTGTSEATVGVMEANLFPQPNNGWVNYRIALQRPEPISWQVTDMLGRVVKEGNWSVSQVHEGTMDLTHAPAGQYLLRMQGKGTVAIFIAR